MERHLISAAVEGNELVLWSVHGDESGWQIVTDDTGVFRLYELPLYGGEPRYQDTYTNFFTAYNDALRWT